MYRKIEDKYIDLSKFPKRIIDGKEVVAWSKTAGIETDFIYDGEVHHLKIIEYVDRKNLIIELDNTVQKKVQPKSVQCLSFKHEFYERKFKFNVGDVVNNMLITDRFMKGRDPGTKYTHQAYRYRCVEDGYMGEKFEYELLSGSGCPVCAGNTVVEGINDIATTDKWMVQYFKNPDDAKKYAHKSNFPVLMQCPQCGAERRMLVSDLYVRGFSCPACSDGISYPNKFAHELFRQLSDQYDQYCFEYSPIWAKPYKYDNYIKMLDGREIIVEMDGAFHFKDDYENNDDIKDRLASERNIKVVRINCDYPDVACRYNYVKNNVVSDLSPYFKLSNIDWDECNLAAVNSKALKAIELYNQDVGIADCAAELSVHRSTIRSYLKLGDKLNLCRYEPDLLPNGEHERLNGHKPIAMMDKYGNILEVFPSVAHLYHELGYDKKTVQGVCIGQKKSYRGYLFKYISREKYFENCKLSAVHASGL